MSTAELKLNGTTIISESGGTADLHNLGTVDTTGLKINGVDAITDSVNGISFNNSGIADDSISGDKIDGGTISNFSSTGITDNATSKSITILNSNRIGIGTESPDNELHIAKQIRYDKDNFQYFSGDTPMYHYNFAMNMVGNVAYTIRIRGVGNGSGFVNLFASHWTGSYLLYKQSYLGFDSYAGNSIYDVAVRTSATQGSWSISRPADGETGYRTDMLITKSAGSYVGTMNSVISIISHWNMYTVEVT